LRTALAHKERKPICQQRIKNPMPVSIRECHTAEEVRENFLSTRAYFRKLDEVETLKAELDQYRALCERLKAENSAIKSKLARATPSEVADDPLTTDKIIRVVAKHYGVCRDEIVTLRRCGRAPEARHVAMYLARRLTGQTFPQLGRIFHRDHSSVVHAIKKIGRNSETDQVLADLLKELCAQLLNGESNLAMTAG
jgi:chromosomal replication initiation ATPase DnaA